MKIGDIQLKSELILGPMAGYTDGGFRKLCAAYGAGLTVTEMVSAKGLCYGNNNTAALLYVSENENPVSVQLFGNDPEFIKMAVEHPSLKPFDIIDINMGCPVLKVVKNGEGSALMKDPDKVYAVVKAAADNTDKPVTVKIRAGFSADTINAPTVAQAIEAAGGKAVAVHARTREQFYAGTADWDVIKAVKNAVKIPVIGNGDVTDKAGYLKMKEQTGCDGVMVARGALGKPFIFAEFTDNEYEFDVKDAIRSHIDTLSEYLPLRTVVNQMKMHLCFYAKNTGHTKEVRKALAELKTDDDMRRIVDTYF